MKTYLKFFLKCIYLHISILIFGFFNIEIMNTINEIKVTELRNEILRGKYKEIPLDETNKIEVIEEYKIAFQNSILIKSKFILT